jgi:hypothetical protein
MEVEVVEGALELLLLLYRHFLMKQAECELGEGARQSTVPLSVFLQAYLLDLSKVIGVCA